MDPRWPKLIDPDLLTAWAERLKWVDPLTISMKIVMPFTERTSSFYAALAPWSGFAWR